MAFDPGRVKVGIGAGGAFATYQADSDVVVPSEMGPIVLSRPTIAPAVPFILLGRRDFFDGRRICFDQRAQRMEIEPA